MNFMKIKFTIKRIIITALCVTTFIPQLAFASTYSGVNYGVDNVDFGQVSSIEKDILVAKGFRHGGSKGLLKNYYDPKYEDITPENMAEIDAWAKDVVEKSGANTKKMQKEKIKSVALYLKNEYPYDIEAIETGNTYEAAFVGTLLRKNKAICTGYTLGLIRILDTMGIESYMAFSWTNESHAVTRAFADGKWITVEPTGYPGSFSIIDFMNKGYDVDDYVFPSSITFVNSKEELKSPHKTRYAVYARKDIEDFLSKNNFMVYGK